MFVLLSTLVVHVQGSPDPAARQQHPQEQQQQQQQSQTIVWSVLPLSNIPAKLSTTSGHVRWKTESWSTCVDNEQLSKQLGCSVNVPTRIRSVTCVHRFFLTREDESLCLQKKPRPESISICSGPCYQHSPYSYQWQVDAWSNCRYLFVRLSNNRKKYRPKQVRSVTCSHVPSNRPVDSSLCRVFSATRRPRMYRRCRFSSGSHLADAGDSDLPGHATFPNITSCGSGAWGEWSGCQYRLHCAFELCRRRKRIPGTVAANATFEPDDCRGAVQISMCVTPPSPYVLQTDHWPRTCVGISSQHSQGFQVGTRERNVSCINTKDGSTAAHRACGYYKSPRDKVTYSTCVVPRDCRVSPWSEWTYSHNLPGVCILSVEGVHAVWPTNFTVSRSRTVTAPRFGDGATCPSLTKINLLTPSDAVKLGVRKCSRLYEWSYSDWSNCTQEMDNEGNVRCRQVREVFCQVSGSSPGNASQRVDDLLCSPGYLPRGVAWTKPVETRDCGTECLPMCTLSLWSAWSPCKQATKCTDRRLTASSWQTRSRTVLRAVKGRQCKHVAEKRRCGHQRCLHYVTDERSGPCGVNDTVGRPDGSWGCVFRLRLGGKRRRCRCSRRCPSWSDIRAMDVWRDYGQCEPVGEGNSSEWQQIKYRPPQSVTHSHCPTEFITRPCVPSLAKPVFAWHAGEFPENCLDASFHNISRSLLKKSPPPKCKVCGTGIRYRPVACVPVGLDGELRVSRSDDGQLHQVDRKKCPAGPDVKPHHAEMCHICCKNPPT